VPGNQRQSVLFPVSTRTQTDGIGLFTGQIGYAWNASLFYVRGGAAVTSNRFSILDTPTGVELAAASATRWGGTVGVGWEYGFAPNWSFGIEYDHLFMGDANNSFTGIRTFAEPCAGECAGPVRWTCRAAWQLWHRHRCVGVFRARISSA
jgi:opacity protein-like surface antigen